MIKVNVHITDKLCTAHKSTCGHVLQEKTKLKDLDFYLKMCGKSVYVTYFELWKKPGFDERTVREQMRQVGKDQNGIKMCIQAARRIAENGLQIEALKVIANSSRVNPTARDKAKSLLKITAS
ncbi:hypothetical protein P9761_14505 [Brevibacillus centrosporus]|uniref:hypothetical protein n=1 Tax=Brevibacillus centrosporus TaxID=54910 RepID=UPI002E247FB8|nr:hypothetical protein [Brevibacillus centrosporus]